MKKRSIHIIMAFALILAYWSSSSYIVAHGAEKITTLEGITEYKLDNGLKVILFPDSSKPVTTVNVTYLVGSRHEGYGETGMAHLLEHLMFKGSKNHTDIKEGEVPYLYLLSKQQLITESTYSDYNKEAFQWYLL